MTPFRWEPSGWLVGAVALALFFLALTLAKPPARLVLTHPSAGARCGVVAGSPVPPKPLGPTHTRPDTKGMCEDGATAINGGCWNALERRPKGPDGCGKAGWEHGGKCWNPVWEAPRPPQSATP